VPWRARTIVQRHGALRAGRPQLKRDPLGSPRADCMTISSGAEPTSPPRRSQRSTALLVVAYILSAWVLYWLWIHFQLLEMRLTDYVSLLTLALAVSATATLRRWIDTDRPRSSLRELTSLFFVVGLITYFVGGAALLTVNAVFDTATPQLVATTVARTDCVGRAKSLALKGGPDLRTKDHSVRLAFLLFGCQSAREGDLVVLDVKPGFLRQAWIADYRMGTHE